ncbi:MAG: caspase family protein [Pseudomonadota bacterium]
MHNRRAVLAGMLGLTMLSALPAHAFTAKRALVIGNGDYRHGPDLRNPVRDARAIRDALSGLDFDVTYAENLSLRGLSTALATFSRKLQPQDMAVVYFAGHGVFVDGTTYLMPTDALMRDEHDLITAFPVNEVMDMLRTDLRAGLVLIDACRDNPLVQTVATRSIRQSGSSPSNLKLPFGMVISYAAQPGAVAYDGQGLHSPYTEALLRHIGRVGLDVEMMLRDVRRDVVFATHGEQITWTQSSLLDGFSLAGPGPQTRSVQEAPLLNAKRRKRLSTLRHRLCKALRGPKAKVYCR